MKILHVIVGLDVGGAEMMLKRLIESHRRQHKYIHRVVSLTDIGHIGQELQAIGIDVRAIGMSGPRSVPRTIWQLRALILGWNPDIVQTWMYHADLLGALAARIAGNVPVIWGVHTTDVASGGSRLTTSVMRACARVSNLPRAIVCVAEASRRKHVEAGYAERKMIVLPNGIDFSGFVATPEQRAAVRAECGFTDDAVVIGTLGRFNPAKDCGNFVRAAGLLAEQNANVRFLMVGLNLDWNNQELTSLIDATGHRHRFGLLGRRTDVASCLAAMDIFCLSSRSEALPTVIAEAMAMEVPCVVTDVGDAAAMVGGTGVVVPKQDAAALAEGLADVVAMPHSMRDELGQRGRERAYSEYGIERARERYEALYETTINDIKGAN